MSKEGQVKKKMVKWNIGLVKDYVRQNSECVVISNEYLTLRTILDFQCKCNNVFHKAFGDFRRSKDKMCKECISKKYIEKAKEYIETESESGCKLLTETFKENNSSIDIQCKCGRTYKTTYSNFRNYQQSCEVCSGRIQWDYQRVKDFVEGEEGNGCKLLSTSFIRVGDKLKYKCACGEDFSATFRHFYEKDKRQCNDCSLKRRSDMLRHDYEYVKSEIENSGECRLLSDSYVDITTPLLILCKCGRTYESHFRSLQNRESKKCDVCNGIKHDIRSVKEYLNKYGEGTVLLSDVYVNAVTDLEFKCKCGDRFCRTFNDMTFAKRHKCTLCGGNKTAWNIDLIRSFVHENSDCELISTEYTNSNDKLIFRCKCKKIFKTSFAYFNFNRQRRCSNCAKKISKGEAEVLRHLENNNINFAREYKFNDCRNTNPLPFDFAILNNEDNLIFLVEYDGEGHTMPIDFAGKGEDWALSHLEDVRKRDKIKTDYCKNNNIPLLRISYLEINDIEKILTSELKSYNLV